VRKLASATIALTVASGENTKAHVSDSCGAADVSRGEHSCLRRVTVR
jgi:hypothetical protein